MTSAEDMPQTDAPTSDAPQDEAIASAPEAGSAAADPAADRIAKLEEELATAKQEVLYALADTQNVRRRLEKELADARAYAATSFSRDILSVADNLERALSAIGEELRADDRFKALVTGLDATAKDMDNVLKKHGVERFQSIGQPLDPNRHQAMIEVPSADAEPGTVVQELQAGYMIKDRLLRPALVGIAKAGE